MASYDVASNVCQALRRGGQQKFFVSPLKCNAKSESTDDEPAAARGRREMVLNSSSLLVLGSLFNTGAAPRPGGLGLRQYGEVVTLGLCPPAPNCVSTAEELNDDGHYIPPWTYNPQEGRATRGATQAQAMEELVDAVNTTDCDGYEVTIVSQLADYLYVEYKNPRFGGVDDVEFFFQPGDLSRVEYRSASRTGKASEEYNRKRIKALRVALNKKGWKSIGF